MILQLSYQIYNQIMTYAQITVPNEVTGLGTVIKHQTRTETILEVEEIFLPKQNVNAGHCELADDAMLELMNQLLQRENGAEATARLCFRWHSHGYSSTFWSSEDEEDIRRWKGAYLASIVVNAHGDLLARLDCLEQGIYNIPIECVIVMPIDDETHAKCQLDIMNNVTEMPMEEPYRKEDIVNVLQRPNQNL